MIERRTFLIGSAAFAALSACQPSGPGSVTISAQGSAGMNPGPDGADRPLTLQVIQLRGAGSFDSADFFALQNPSALGADFIKADTITLAPGGPASKTIGLDPGTTVIGVVAGFREPGGKQFRAKSAVSATSTVAFSVVVGSGGVTLTPA